MRIFNPNTNPFADDLLRLRMAPSTRFSPRERRTFAKLVAGKLYGLELNGPGFTFPSWRAMHGDLSDRRLVVVNVHFDSDLQDVEKSSIIYDTSSKLKFIVLSVGDYGVVELFNGSWEPSMRGTILSAIKNIIKNIGDEENVFITQESNGILPRSDEEVRRDYLGEGPEDRDRGAPGGGGGDGGDQRGGGGGGRGPGGGGDGANEGSGTGGTGELLNHPVLFAVERNIFDAILAQT